jgi:dTDP-4-dehydrorhamnose reductase
MILLLGASGYIGQAFATELQRRQSDFLPLSRRELDYTRFVPLLEFRNRNQDLSSTPPVTRANRT